MTGAALLDGVRVLDLTKATSGPFATQILADLGADVIKIEEPSGSALGRSILEPDRLVAGMDPYFLSVNRGKKSVVLPLATDLGRDTFYELVRKSDVVVSNFRPGVDRKLGVDHETLAGLNDKIVSCSLSGFGRTGPLKDRAAFDITVLGETGMMAYIEKRAETGALAFPIVSIADLLGGMYVAVAVSAALERVRRTQQGCDIEIAMHDAVLSWFIGYGTALLNFGEAEHYYEGAIWGTFQTATEPLIITAHRHAQWRNCCRALGRDAWLSDPRFADPLERKQNIVTLRELINGVMRERPADEWAAVFEREKVPFARVNTVKSALESAQTSARDMVVGVTFPTGESARLLGNPIKVSDVAYRPSAPPVLGQHTAQVLQDVLGLTGDALKAVLDLSQAIEQVSAV